jgi:hypothetical protein
VVNEPSALASTTRGDRVTSSVVPAAMNCRVRRSPRLTRSDCSKRPPLVPASGSSANCSPRASRQRTPSKSVRTVAFQYAAWRGAHAEDLAAVPRPVQRAVAVVPAERRRAALAELLRELLVVDPRVDAVQARREGQAGERGGDDRDGGERRLAAGEPLEPEERGEEDREQRAGQERALVAQLDGGHAVQDGQRERPRRAGARPARGAARTPGRRR